MYDFGYRSAPYAMKKLAPTITPIMEKTQKLNRAYLDTSPNKPRNLAEDSKLHMVAEKAASAYGREEKLQPSLSQIIEDSGLSA